jgi:hypothetical protein
MLQVARCAAVMLQAAGVRTCQCLLQGIPSEPLELLLQC